MAYTIELQTITNDRGSLTVIEKILPFEIKRVYYVYNVPGETIRAGHGHREALSALVSVNGTRVVKVLGSSEQRCILDRPDLCLVLLPGDWHEITDFSRGAILMVLSSEYYDPTDYVYEKPE